MIDSRMVEEMADAGYAPDFDDTDPWKPESNVDEHPIYTVEEWKMDVALDQTRLGYHAYVNKCLALEEAGR
jgi:hypothetical protein